MTPGVHLVVMLTTPLAPLLVALALMLAPGCRVMGRAAVLAPVPALLTCLLMPPGIGATLPWLLEGSEFGLDPVGRVFLLFSSAIWLAAALSASTFVADARRVRFLVFFLLAMSGNLGMLIARDMLAFYLFFSLMSFAAYGLVVHAGSAEARRAGQWYLGLVVAGDMMLYAALVAAALDAGGTVLLAEVRETIAESPHRDMIIALTFAGFGVKAGAIGLHVALPMIYRVAPIPAGAALAGAMLHAGLLGWLRFLPIGAEVPGWGRTLLAAGLTGTLYGALVGSVQRDPRSVLAYSSISQIGIMLGGVGAALLAPQHASGIAAALAVYALHHAFVKSTLFLGLGIASRGARGRAASMVLRAGLLLPALALPGLPLTSGSLAKEYLKEELAAADAESVALFAAALPWTAVATTVVAARFLWLAWPLATPARPAAGASVKPGPTSAEWTAFASLLLLALVGAWLQPIVRRPELWSLPVLSELTWPVVSGALIAWFAARATAAGRLPRAPALPSGDIAIPLERGLRRAAAGWRRVSFGPLPNARDAVRAASTAALADRRWSALLEAMERVLTRWGPATACFVLIALVLAFLLLLASGAGRGN